MDQEEIIIYDVDGFKKELEDPLSVEEVELRDPLDSQTCSEPESHATIKEEAVSSWRETSEEHPVQASMAPFLPSGSLQSQQEAPKSPFQNSVLHYGHSDIEEPSVLPGFQMQTDQAELNSTSVSHPKATELQSPEIIFVDSDSETGPRISQQVSSSNSNSESGIWSQAREVFASPGINSKLDDGSEERMATNASTKNKISVMAPKKRKAKQRKNMKLSKTSSSLPTTQPANVHVSQQSVTDMRRSCSPLQQIKQNLLASQQATVLSQQTEPPNQQNTLENQQSWSSLHQFLSLSSQLYNRNQSATSSIQDPQLLIQGSQFDQQSLTSILRYPPSAQVTSAQVTSAQHRVIPSSPKSSFMTSSAGKTRLESMVSTDATNATKSTPKPQVELNTGIINTEREFLNLKHKMEVQELKLRLRNRKAKAELEESELKLKMEANVQDLTNKKLKHNILLAKLQFYSKLCSMDKL